MLEIISLILNVLLTGGLIVTIATLKSKRRQESITADKMAIEKDSAVMTAFKDFVVEPLKKETTKLRYETNKLRKAIERVGECDHKEKCPVMEELKKDKENEKMD